MTICRYVLTGFKTVERQMLESTSCTLEGSVLVLVSLGGFALDSKGTADWSCRLWGFLGVEFELNGVRHTRELP